MSEAGALEEPVVPTGHSGADRALAELEGISSQPVAEHPGLYQRAHDRLTDVLEAPVNAVPAHHG
ncbi:hypothetical protein FCK90_14235 [Kocuria coralli]|uniref:Uncharacterized protein n=1 Tax=Kocuria coralli TaxID=1461025 RepID=A0A5J5KTQ5_9MICC|nr:hypothetical protein [Kocuria coralli]KAA9393023.1 hypothetical protein FCK90_14235 [Kocuria coralli]